MTLYTVTVATVDGQAVWQRMLNAESAESAVRAAKLDAALHTSDYPRVRDWTLSAVAELR